MKTQKTLSAAALLACVAFGCDSQAGSDYKGESLLSVEGAIVASEGVSLDDDVVPVLAWYLRDQDGFSVMKVQDVSVSGDFPSKFKLVITQPPVAEALEAQPKTRTFESEPRMTFAHIGALPRKHDSEVYLGIEDAVGSSCTAIEEDSEQYTCVDEYCDYYGQCFQQTNVCVLETDECTSTTTGSTRVQNGLGVMSGFVNDYGLVYLDGEAKKGSLTAWQLGVEQLDAGFHLVRLVDVEESFEDVDEPCVVAAYETGSQRFEEAYGVSADEVDDESSLADALYTFVDAAAMETNCPEQRVLDFEFVDLSERITMTLGDELELW